MTKKQEKAVNLVINNLKKNITALIHDSDGKKRYNNRLAGLFNEIFDKIKLKIKLRNPREEDEFAKIITDAYWEYIYDFETDEEKARKLFKYSFLQEFNDDVLKIAKSEGKNSPIYNLVYQNEGWEPVYSEVIKIALVVACHYIFDRAAIGRLILKEIDKVDKHYKEDKECDYTAQLTGQIVEREFSNAEIKYQSKATKELVENAYVLNFEKDVLEEDEDTTLPVENN